MSIVNRRIRCRLFLKVMAFETAVATAQLIERPTLRRRGPSSRFALVRPPLVGLGLLS
jgi:hypothetical protein